MARKPQPNEHKNCDAIAGKNLEVFSRWSDFSEFSECFFLLCPSALSSILLVVMEQKMVFPEKSPWVMSHCRKSYKSFNPVRALKILLFSH